MEDKEAQEKNGEDSMDSMVSTLLWCKVVTGMKVNLYMTFPLMYLFTCIFIEAWSIAVCIS